MKFLLLALIVLSANAISLKDYPFYNYEVYFTNPVCEQYFYEKPILSNDGTTLFSKPKNVYCKNEDSLINEFRITSPHYHLLKLINDQNIKELFLTYLSFSNHQVADALCRAIRRDVKVTFIIDSNNENRASARSELDFVASCRPKNIENEPRVEFRGNISGLGYAHNKIILAKYKNEPSKRTVVFGSANMSMGTTLHHENWNFVTTHQDSYFYQIHECIQSGMLNIQSRSGYKKFISECKKQIKTSEEDDIKVFVVPSDGDEAIKRIKELFNESQSIDGIAHRFLHPDFVSSIKIAQEEKRFVRFIFDDDIYWAGVRKKTTGVSVFAEFLKVLELLKVQTQVRYMQTNQNKRQLQHNKFLIFNLKDGGGVVHTGAGNFTKAAFSKNFENYYHVYIPEIVDQFRVQYEHMFNKLATSYELMPAIYSNP